MKPLDLSDAGYEWCARHEQYEEPDSDHEAVS